MAYKSLDKEQDTVQVQRCKWWNSIGYFGDELEWDLWSRTNHPASAPDLYNVLMVEDNQILIAMLKYVV